MKPKQIRRIVPTMILLFIFILILISVRCDTTEPPTIGSLTLALEDVSCTEAWLQLKLSNVELPSLVTLYKNNVAAQNNILCYGDTLLYVDSLLPKQTYKFKAVLPTTNNAQTTSNELSVTTMDTTSHNFTWQTFTFGQHSSSVLYDVAIINENNIWAVGEIYMNDSLGQTDPIFYNVVHWDGSEWELKRLRFNCRLYFPNCGPDTMLLSTAYSIFATDANNIWISAGSVHHFNGSAWTQEAGILGAGSAKKIWGTTNELWFVGDNGFITHKSDKGSWTKIESGTTFSIGDIWGIMNRAGEYNKYLAAGDAMLKVNQQNEIEDVKLEPDMFVNLLWGMTDNLIYTAGNGIVLYKNNKWEKIDIHDINTVYGIRGSNYNNIFGLSSTLSILHFNGYSWRDINTGGINIYYRLEVKNNLAVTVGWQGDKAALTLLNKN